MSRLFFVFGTEGSGKTTVLSGITSVKVINIGNEMFRVFSERFGITDRDEIRAKSLENYEFMVKTRHDVLKKAGEMQGTVAIDTHVTVKKGDAYEIGLSLDDLDTLKGKAAGIVYIDAPNKEILERRERDKGRNRQKDTEETLSRHRNLNLACLAVYAIRMEVPIYIVENPHNMVEATRGRVLEILKGKK